MNRKISCVLLSFLLASCCQVVRGPTQMVSISSEPLGANVIIDGKNCGVTPGNFPLARNSAHDIILSKEGYVPKKYHIKTKKDLLVASNALLPVIGTAVGIAGGFLCLPHGYGLAGMLYPFTGSCIGLGVGTGAACTGAVYDVSSGAASRLSTDRLNAILRPITLPACDTQPKKS